MMSLEKSIFSFIFRLAYRDAIMRRAYSGESLSTNEYNKIEAYVKTYIDKLLSEEYPDFMDAANGLKDFLNKYDDFSFGNIQKLLNMTTKYVYIICYNHIENRRCFSKCHCPMDNTMIRIVWNEYKSNYKKEGWDKELLWIPYDNEKKGTDYSRIAWSRIGFEAEESPRSISVYFNFQNMVRRLSECKGIFPVEYDYIMWESKAKLIYGRYTFFD